MGCNHPSTSMAVVVAEWHRKMTQPSVKVVRTV